MISPSCNQDFLRSEAVWEAAAAPVDGSTASRDLDITARIAAATYILC
jgi:hypothetical protein